MYYLIETTSFGYELLLLLLEVTDIEHFTLNKNSSNTLHLQYFTDFGMFESYTSLMWQKRQYNDFGDEYSRLYMRE